MKRSSFLAIAIFMLAVFTTSCASDTSQPPSATASAPLSPAKDEDKQWLMANKDNYHTIKDVFYLDADTWPELGYFPSAKLDDLKKLVYENPKLALPKTKLFLRNFGQWFKHLFKKKKQGYESYFNL